MAIYEINIYNGNTGDFIGTAEIESPELPDYISIESMEDGEITYYKKKE